VFGENMFQFHQVVNGDSESVFGFTISSILTNFTIRGIENRWKIGRKIAKSEDFY
jgi:hypothetical protein